MQSGVCGNEMVKGGRDFLYIQWCYTLQRILKECQPKQQQCRATLSSSVDIYITAKTVSIICHNHQEIEYVTTSDFCHNQPVS